jgi:hypothetical protein
MEMMKIVFSDILRNERGKQKLGMGNLRKPTWKKKRNIIKRSRMSRRLEWRGKVVNEKERKKRSGKRKRPRIRGQVVENKV